MKWIIENRSGLDHDGVFSVVRRVICSYVEMTNDQRNKITIDSAEYMGTGFDVAFKRNKASIRLIVMNQKKNCAAKQEAEDRG